MAADGKMSKEEVNRLGGNARVARMSEDELRAMARKGGTATFARYGKDHYRELGRKGGNETKRRGRVSYQSIGRLGGRALTALAPKRDEGVL